ncbi:MAG TPA: CusA/CzcA family heavy metal efflux RND transporter [Terriglobia bacterium]|jgi:cobalt-zinc-cadmium resistance protein CzcA|nr:CusA/CzcA family heavy metal efflux RND transporter [Terriglobia bacterium]
MIRRIVDFALKEKLLVMALAFMLLVWGVISFHRLPIEAYPDIADVYVQVITQWPGRAAEEVEQQITVPLEVQLNGVPHLAHLRSVSLFGLSVVTMIFDDDADDLWSREQVLEKLSLVSLPTNVSPQLGPDYSPAEQIYFYTLTSANPRVDLMDIKSLQDWVLVNQLKSVPNIVDDAIFGGTTREYQVQVDPNRLIAYGLSLPQVETAVANNNVNAGGSFIEHGEQAFNVRAIGLVTQTDDIANTVIATVNGTPVRVRDVATVVQGAKIRLGQTGRAAREPDGSVKDDPDVVQGIVLLRKGAEAEGALKALHAKVKDLNQHVLPPGVKVVPFLDRDDLVHYTTHTVLQNLTAGILLVTVILFLFLGNIRSALIVAATIPFSLLFASILLDLRRIPANLLSLGALDFGMVVDGAVVMVENILRHLSRPSDADIPLSEKISRAAHEVQRPVFYAILIIITAYMPIFTLQRVEGKLFRPMAFTVAFALLGALLFSLILAPVFSSILFRKGVKEWHNPVLAVLIKSYRRTLGWCIEHRAITVGVSFLLLVACLATVWSGAIGSEFLPHLDEGAIWARGTLAPSAGPSEGEKVMEEARRMFISFPEVTQVVSQVGRPDDGTDSTGFFNTEYFVDLKPRDQWRPQFKTKDELIAAMDKQVSVIPGVDWGFSQPIADNVEEAVSGVKGQLAVKIFGGDLHALEDTADKIEDVMKTIPGIADLGVFRVLGQPNVNLVVDRLKASRFGLNVSDVQDGVQTAVGGNAVSQVLQGERRYDLVIRYQPQFRQTIQDIADIRIVAPTGERVSLGQLCDIQVQDGASMIYREANSRYIAIKYSVRGRDLGSTVRQAMNEIAQKVTLPEGYHLDWAGEYESEQRANRRLSIVVPITVLIIFIILYTEFDSFKWSGLILTNVALAPIGGVLALLVTGTHFSVSSGVGFLALFGVSVQIGVIMITYINQLRARGHSVKESAVEGAVLRLRPIMMTMLVATLGLLPAALSHDIGSDSQRPFAIVIVGGLIADLLISVMLLPTLYVWFARPGDKLPSAEEAFEE